MNTYSTSRIPILLIEDDPAHVTQIQRQLEKGYRVTPIDSVNEEKLLNFKALHPKSQIVIVDLHLDISKDPDPAEGMKAIRDRLWVIDRTTFFIIYSAYIESYVPNINTFEPHCAFVLKEFVKKSTTLTDKSLANLSTMVEICREYSSPLLKRPEYDPLHWTDIADRYLELYQNKVVKQHHIDFKAGITRATNMLTRLSQESESYAKAGQRSAVIAIGVFGSCGRLEYRKDSDVECSVYYSDTGTLTNNENLAIAFWNRIVRYMAASKPKIKFEGEKLLKGKETMLLNEVDVLECKKRNRYLPVVKREEVLEQGVGDEQIKLRHLQILTELRPVFNGEFILDFKREIIRTYAGKTSDLRSIIDSDYIRDQLVKFMLVTRPKDLGTRDGYKKYVYRIMNVLALKLYFIHKLTLDDRDPDTNEAWATFFDELCNPGVVKVMNFAIRFHEHQHNDKKANVDNAQEKFSKLIEEYLLMLRRFGVKDNTPDQLVKPARDTAGYFFELFDLLPKLKCFAGLHTSAEWLFSTVYEKDVVDRLSLKKRK